MATEGEPVENPSGLADFVKAAEQFGVSGISYERHPDGTEVLVQNLGEGWPGLGYDGQNLWLGLTPHAPQANKNDWNANTVLEEGVSYDGILEDGLSQKHPITQLFAKLSKRRGVEVHVTGGHVGWVIDERTRLNPDRDEEKNVVALRGTIPRGTQIKAVVTNVEAKWEDGNWRLNQPQKLTVPPPPAKTIPSSSN